MKQKNPAYAGMSRSEMMVMTVTEIISELIAAHEKKENINLNKLKNAVARKYGLSTQPRLVDIIAAVPSNYRKALVPKLKAKPVRTASGVQFFFIWIPRSIFIYELFRFLLCNFLKCPYFYHDYR